MLTLLRGRCSPPRSRGEAAAIAVAIAVALLAGCTVAASRPTSPSPSVATPGPTPVRPTPVATPRVLTPTDLDPTLALRVDIRPDVSFGRIPLLSIFRDGTVLALADNGADVLRLTPAGLAEVVREASSSGLLTTSGTIGPDPNWAAGFGTYVVALATDDGLVTRIVSNAAPADRMAEVEPVIALAEHLAEIEAWLAAGAWEVGRDAAVPWVPDRYLLKVVDWGHTQPDPPLLDVASLPWPLEGTPLDVPELDDRPLGEDVVVRCTVIDLAEALELEEAVRLALQGQAIPMAQLGVDVGWRDRGTSLTLGLHALLPDDPSDCAVDLAWP